jgi:hypothetical protein
VLIGSGQLPAWAFLPAAAPAMLAGMITPVGLPVEHDLNRFEKLAVRCALLAAIGVGGFLGVRRLASESGGALQRLPHRVRLTLALTLDRSPVAAVVAGLLAAGRRILHLHGNAWADLVVVLAFIAGAIGLTRAGGGATLGERLFGCLFPGPGASRPVAAR